MLARKKEKNIMPWRMNLFNHHHEDVQILINDIVRHRESQIKRYGRESYDRLMEKNKLNNVNTKGFWQQAKLV